jgi:hypothetical protein
VKNVTALNVTFDTEKYRFHYDFQVEWVEERLEIIWDNLPLLTNLTHLGLQLDFNHFGRGLGQKLIVLRNLIQNNLPRNLLAIVINFPRTLSKAEVSAMLQCIVDQCTNLEVLVLKNLTSGLFPTDILNTLQKCKNLNHFVVQSFDQDLTKNTALGFSTFLKYEAVKNQEQDSFTATVLTVEKSEDLERKIELLFGLIDLKCGMMRNGENFF